MKIILNLDRIQNKQEMKTMKRKRYFATLQMWDMNYSHVLLSDLLIVLIKPDICAQNSYSGAKNKLNTCPLSLTFGTNDISFESPKCKL